VLQQMGLYVHMLLVFAASTEFTLAQPAASSPAPVFAHDTEYAIVRTLEEFQVALQAAVQHIVVVEHIDMTQAPVFSNATVAENDAVAGILSDRVSAKKHTETIRVRPTELLQTLVPSDSPAVVTNHFQQALC
jgi:hypothetical protein